MKEIYLDRTEKNDWIEFALQYGTLKESDWRYGKK